MSSADQASAAELDHARAFIDGCRWAFAKSVPQHPHEYSLRRWLEPGCKPTSTLSPP